MQPRTVEAGDVKHKPLKDAKRSRRGDLSVRSVIIDDGDNRQTVADPTVFPYHDIALVHALDRNGRLGNVGTAFFVAPGIIATAAHVVCHQIGFADAGDFTAAAADFWFGYSRGATRGEYYRATEFFVHPSYDPVTGEGIDVAVIRLAAAANVRVISPKSFSPGPSGVDFWLAGYPAEAPWDGMTLYEASSDYAVVRGDRLLHRIDATPGQSGGPVWWYDGREIQIIGVHNEGTSASFDNDRLANGAAYMTEELIDWILSYQWRGSV